MLALLKVSILFDIKLWLCNIVLDFLLCYNFIINNKVIQKKEEGMENSLEKAYAEVDKIL